MRFIHENSDWPNLSWDNAKLLPLLADVRHRQGRLLGRMEGLGFRLRAEASLTTLTADVMKSSAIEGALLDAEQVRSSIARRLGLDFGGNVPVSRDVEGVVEMMLDATQNYLMLLAAERLFGRHAGCFRPDEAVCGPSRSELGVRLTSGRCRLCPGLSVASGCVLKPRWPIGKRPAAPSDQPAAGWF